MQETKLFERFLCKKIISKSPPKIKFSWIFQIFRFKNTLCVPHRENFANAFSHFFFQKDPKEFFFIKKFAEFCFQKT